MSPNDQNPTSDSKLPPTRCYEKPELRDYGDIRSLTQDRGTTPPSDGGLVVGFTASAP